MIIVTEAKTAMTTIAKTTSKIIKHRPSSVEKKKIMLKS